MTRLDQRWHASLLAVFLFLTGCGGGGGGGDSPDWLYPLWVPTDVLVADVDDDGRADIVTLAQYSSSASQREGRVIVHRQGTSGTFAAGETYIVGLYPWQFAAADIDGDGSLDLVVADVDGGAVFFLPQDSANHGRFLAPRLITNVAAPYDVTIADFNGDGAPDIAVASDLKDSHRLVMLYQDPVQRGSFLPAVALAVPGSSCTAVESGDVDGDGRADLLMSIALAPSGYTPNLVLGVSLQRSDGSLSPVTTLASQQGLLAGRLAIADYDGDGRNDLLAYFKPSSANFHAKLTVLLQGPAPGTFAAPADTSLEDVKGLDDAVFADLDGDGRPDAAVTGSFPVGSPSTVKSRLTVFTQSGLGLFAQTSSQDLSFPANRLTAGDIDQDGRNELVPLGSEDQFLVIQ